MVYAQSTITVISGRDRPVHAREPVWLSGKAGKQRDLDSNPPRFSFQKLWSVDTVLSVTLFLTVNETLKWLSSLPIFMQGSFWW